jgi:cation transport ATPase
MAMTPVDERYILSRIPGRLRLHLPGWDGAEAEQIEMRLRRLAGVKDVEANRLTHNVLIHFDPRATEERRLLEDLPRACGDLLTNDAAKSAERRKGARSAWLRVGVRGLLGHAAVDSLWFTAGFIGQSFGLPLAAALGPLHVLADVAVWGLALRSGLTGGSPAAGNGARLQGAGERG